MNHLFCIRKRAVCDTIPLLGGARSGLHEPNMVIEPLFTHPQPLPGGEFSHTVLMISDIGHNIVIGFDTEGFLVALGDDDLTTPI